MKPRENNGSLAPGLSRIAMATLLHPWNFSSWELSDILGVASPLTTSKKAQLSVRKSVNFFFINL